MLTPSTSRRLILNIAYLVVLCFVLFFSISFFYCLYFISFWTKYFNNKSKRDWGKLKRTLTWSYLLTYLQTYPHHDIMIYRLKAIKLKSLNAIFHTLVNSSIRRSRKEYIFLFKEKTCRHNKVRTESHWFLASTQYLQPYWPLHHTYKHTKPESLKDTYIPLTCELFWKNSSQL